MATRGVSTYEVNPDILHVHKSFYDSVIRNVEDLLKQKGLTMPKLAEANKWNYFALNSALYRNSTISSLWLARLSIGLDVDICELLKQHPQ